MIYSDGSDLIMIIIIKILLSCIRKVENDSHYHYQDKNKKKGQAYCPPCCIVKAKEPAPFFVEKNGRDLPVKLYH